MSKTCWACFNSIGTAAAAAAAKSLQSCPTLCDLIDGSPPGSPVPGVLQARTLEWVAISFSNAWKWKNKVKLLSRVWLLVTPWTAALQAPPSMGFSRQEYWSGVPLPSPSMGTNKPKSYFSTLWRLEESSTYQRVFSNLPAVGGLCSMCVIGISSKEDVISVRS